VLHERRQQAAAHHRRPAFVFRRQQLQLRVITRRAHVADTVFEQIEQRLGGATAEHFQRRDRDLRIRIAEEATLERGGNPGIHVFLELVEDLRADDRRGLLFEQGERQVQRRGRVRPDQCFHQLAALRLVGLREREPCLFAHRSRQLLDPLGGRLRYSGSWLCPRLNRRLPRWVLDHPRAQGRTGQRGHGDYQHGGSELSSRFIVHGIHPCVYYADFTSVRQRTPSP
jgi:hypothetical protein